MTIARAIVRSWQDNAYKEKLLDDPSAALSEVGVIVPEDANILVEENTEQRIHLVLPVAPRDAGSFSEEQLQQIAAAYSTLIWTHQIKSLDQHA